MVLKVIPNVDHSSIICHYPGYRITEDNEVTKHKSKEVEGVFVCPI